MLSSLGGHLIVMFAQHYVQGVTSHPVTVADIVQVATTLHTTTASSYYVVLHNSFHLSGSGMFLDHNFGTSA